MSAIPGLGGIAAKALSLIKDKVGDVLTDSKEARAFAKQLELVAIQQRTELARIEAEEHEAIVNATRDQIVADAKGESWLQRNWRPIGMLTLIGLVVLMALPGLVPWVEVNPALDVTALMQGVLAVMGLYSAGRSGEKMMRTKHNGGVL